MPSNTQKIYVSSDGEQPLGKDPAYSADALGVYILDEGNNKFIYTTNDGKKYDNKDNPYKVQAVGIYIESSKVKPIDVLSQKKNFLSREIITEIVEGKLPDKDHVQRKVLYHDDDGFLVEKMYKVDAAGGLRPSERLMYMRGNHDSDGEDGKALPGNGKNEEMTVILKINELAEWGSSKKADGIAFEMNGGPHDGS